MSSSPVKMRHMFNFQRIPGCGPTAVLGRRSSGFPNPSLGDNENEMIESLKWGEHA